MRSIAVLAVAVTVAVLPTTVAAHGLYSPTVIHGTSPGPAVVAPARPAAAASGVTSIAPSVVLGWGGLAPATGQPPVYHGSAAPGAYPGYPAAVPYHPGYPGHGAPYPVHPPYPAYPGYAVPPGVIVAPTAPDTVHRWGTR